MKKLFLALFLSLCLVTPAWAVIDFDGTDDSLNSSASWSFGVNVITLCFWLNWDNFADNDDLAFEFSVNINNNEHTFIVDPNESATSGFQVALTGTSGFRAEYITRPSADIWHHYAIVIDNSTATGDIKIYLNGTEQATTIQINDKAGSANFKDDTLYFMSRNNSSLNGDGKMEEFYVFTKELNQGEIDILAKSRIRGAGLEISNRFTYNSIDDGTAGTSADGDTIADRSGNGKTLVGNDGGNNTGLLWKGTSILTYPRGALGQ